MTTHDRSPLHFIQKVRKFFSFLVDEGFTEIEALPNLVRYRNGDIEVGIYHELLSYEIGSGITVAGICYSMSEIVRASDPEADFNYMEPNATTPEGVTAGVEKLSVLMQRYGAMALRGDPHFFSILKEQRRQWSKEFSLDVLEYQLRPQAEDAFRRRDYPKAAELYGCIRKRLSPAEVKKLALAEARVIE